MASVEVQECYRFGRFVLEPDRRALHADEVLVPLGARAFDILLLLVRHRDRVVSKDEILTAVWHGTVVEENNLAVHICAVRRALGEKPGGDRFIATVSGTGYRFVGSVVDGTRTIAEPDVPSVDGSAGERPERPAPMPRPAGFRPIGVVPVAAVVIMAVVAVAIIVGFGGRSPVSAPRLSIAVLPFRSLGASDAKSYLADAVTDDLTTDLSHIPDSVVIARESAEMFRGRAADAESIGRALNVRYLLQGSLLGDGDALHVNAQLVDAASGRHLWANAFDATGNGVEGKLTDTVDRIASALRFTLIQVEGTRSLRDKPRDPDALDLYLRARSSLDRDTSFSGLVAAQGLLEQAIAVSPDFSDALAELGLVLVRKIGEFNDPDAASDYKRAENAVDQSMRLAPESPLSLVANGMLEWLEDQCRPAMASFQLVTSSDDNDVDALTGLARCQQDLGNMVAMITELETILRVDPLGPQREHVQELIGMGYLMLGEPPRALEWLNRVGAVGSASGPGGSGHGWRDWRQVFLIAATEMSGDARRAKEICLAYRQRWPHVSVFRLASFNSKAVSTLPGVKSYLVSLTRAGIPLYSSEDEDYGIDPTSVPKAGGDLDPTPLFIPGASRVLTSQVEALLSKSPKPLVLDVGRGSHSIPGAVLMPDWGSAVELQNALSGRNTAALPIIAMGQGPLGWASYNVSLRLVSMGFHNVFWYRGGEEGWVAAGLPTEDRRQE